METIKYSSVTFKNEMVDTWLIVTPQEVPNDDFRKAINKELDRIGFYNPFTLKAVVNGKGQVKILFYNIDRYKKEDVTRIFKSIDNLYAKDWYRMGL